MKALTNGKYTLFLQNWKLNELTNWNHKEHYFDYSVKSPQDKFSFAEARKNKKTGCFIVKNRSMITLEGKGVVLFCCDIYIEEENTHTYKKLNNKLFISYDSKTGKKQVGFCKKDPVKEYLS